MLRGYARSALPFVAGLFAACTVVQVFLAGLGVFEGPQNFITHREFGYTFSWLILVLVVLAVVGRVPRRITGLALLLGLLFVLQSVFVAFRSNMPQVAALHPVNGFLIVLVALLVTRDAWHARRAPRTAAGVEGRGATAESTEANVS